MFKSRCRFCTPLLLSGQSQPHACGHAWWNRRGSKDTRLPEQHQDRGATSGGTRWALPGRSLAGAAYVAPARALQSNLPNTSKAATLEPKSPDTINDIGTKAREALAWWHADLSQDQGHTILDENQKTETPARSLPGTLTRPPARPLPGKPARPRQDPCRGHLRGRGQAHTYQIPTAIRMQLRAQPAG